MNARETPRPAGTRRTALKALAGSIAAPAILRSQRRSGEKPNLLFVLTDQQRADTMAAYGNHAYRVPAMNRLAAESVIFDRCYVTQPLCTPSRSSLLTGSWPHTNGCIQNNIRLSRDVKTFPELLADDEYATAYYGKWHLGDELFAQRGFESWLSIEDGYDEHFSPDRDRSARSDYHKFLAGNGVKPDQKDGTFSRDFASSLPVPQTKAAFLGSNAAEFILKHRSQPWMLYVGFLEPHRPYNSPLNDLHSAEEAAIPGNFEVGPTEHEPRYYQHLRSNNRSKGYELENRTAIQRLNRNYAGSCTLVDMALSRMLWALEASRQSDNTIIVFTSDHGEMMGSHQMLAKMTMYEESIRVPLLLRAPFRQNRSIHVRQPVSNVSVVRTLLDLMGKKASDGVSGNSLVPTIHDTEQLETGAFVEWHSENDGPAARCVVTPEGWKLAVYQDDNGLLFDCRRDPLESTNLFYRPEYREIRSKLYADIRAWQAATKDPVQLPPV